jgi:hypothetical protein
MEVKNRENSREGKMKQWRRIYKDRGKKTDKEGRMVEEITYLLTHSIEQSPSWEANRFSASQ